MHCFVMATTNSSSVRPHLKNVPIDAYKRGEDGIDLADKRGNLFIMSIQFSIGALDAHILEVMK